MKLRMFSMIFLAVAISLVISNADLFAADQQVTAGCSKATMKGSYGFYRTGNFPEYGPYAAVGILFCDGNGKCKRRQAVSFNGAFEKNTASFDYEVQPDCTGKLTANGVEFAALVIVENGNEIFILHENNQTVYGVYKKIHQ